MVKGQGHEPGHGQGGVLEDKLALEGQNREAGLEHELGGAKENKEGAGKMDEEGEMR